MSTTFEVYPATDHVPTFRQLLDRSNIELKRFLTSVSIDQSPQIYVRVNTHKTHETVALDLDDPLCWTEGTYAWFYVDDVPGGTDAYYRCIEDKRFVEELLLEPARGEANRPRIRACAAQAHYWSFRRSAGQPAIINLAYGLLAASLAELTSGLVTSSDSAWDWTRMPATAEEFFKFYFVPDQALTDEFRALAKDCIRRIPEELQEYSRPQN